MKRKEKTISDASAAAEPGDGPGRFGAVLRRLRQERELTLEQLAERVGVTRGYLSMIENGRVGNPPSGKVLRALEIVLEIEDDTLAEADRWDRTPPPVRAELLRARARAERSELLLRAMRERPGTDAGRSEAVDIDHDSAQKLGVDLDTLYRAGTLARLAGDAGGIAVRRGTSKTGPTDAQACSAKVERFPGPAFRGVPIINKVAAGLPAGFTDLDYPPGSGEDVVLVPGYTGRHGQNDPDAFAAIVHGQSMSPDYREGDIVVFSPLADLVDGCDCYARLEPDHDTTFKRVYFENDGQRIRLHPINPDYPTRTVDRDQVAGLFRAVWRMSRV